MNRRLTIQLPLLVLGLLCIALGLRLPDAPSVDDDTSVEATVTAQGQTPPISLQSKVDAKHREIVNAEIALEGRGSVNGQDSPRAELSGLTFTVVVEIVEASENRLRVELAIDELAVASPDGTASSASEATYQRVKTAIERMPPLIGELVVTRGGVIEKLELGADKGINNQQRQVVEVVETSIAQLLFPRPSRVSLPTTWTSTTETSYQGFSRRQKQVAQTTDGTLVRLRISETPKSTAAVPPGTYADSMKIERLNTMGSAEVRFDAALLFPRTAIVELESVSELAVEQTGAVDAVRSKSLFTLKAQTR